MKLEYSKCDHFNKADYCAPHSWEDMLDCLYREPKFLKVAYISTNDYQGEWVAMYVETWQDKTEPVNFKRNISTLLSKAPGLGGTLHVFRGYYGSCSGCDSLEGLHSFKEVEGLSDLFHPFLSMDFWQFRELSDSEMKSLLPKNTDVSAEEMIKAVKKFFTPEKEEKK